jgi:very-short-patch-repair endonuclease
MKLGVKVRRQHPVGPFIADFCIVERRLIIEIDGGIHAEQTQRDAERTAFLEATGFRVVRLPNERVENDIEAVLEDLRRLLAETNDIDTM